ncbi:MAG: hypothetical protein PHO91_03530 [Patescibacteria group bacterium]|nr:hypothetical protein [Patescibacteria group bacterium]
MKISREIIELYKRLEKIYAQQKKLDRDDHKIEVEEITSHFSAWYEKLRNTVDFKEIHLLRRFAIERNIKRRFIMEMLKPQVARSLIEDMIRARYLPNRSIPESKIKEVEKIIAKYNELFLLMNDMYHGQEINDYFNWLISIEACEIDVLLKPEDVDDAIIEAMYQATKTRIKIQGEYLNIKEKNLQLYIAIHKSLVKSDDTIISYHLLNLYFDRWQNADRETTKILAANLPAIYKTILRHLRHPYQRKIIRSISEPVVTFQVLRELILSKEGDIEYLQDILVDPERLQAEVKVLINQKYKKIRQRINSSSVRAIVYIFITKVLFALLFELPYEIYFDHVNYVNLGINVVFPPLLMFLVTLTIVPPSKKNTEKILENFHNLIYNRISTSILCQLKTKYRQSVSYQIFYYFMYSLLYVLVFGSIVRLLVFLDFNLLSGAIFLFFLTAVSFFAVRIRSTSREFNVEKKKEGLISFFVNFFSLPIVAVGRWMSTKFKRINLFAFIMDYIIEAPFKLFVSALEHWLGFIREKKDEVYHDNQ